MSGNNLNLEMRLTANGGQLASVLGSASRQVRTFADNTNRYTRNMAQGFKNLYQQINGFSMVSKLAATAGGYSLLSDALKRNLEFEKALLDMKQTAEMTTQQAAEMRAKALDAASANLATPTEIVAAMKAFSAAGMKFDKIKPSIDEAARAAVAFRSTVESIAMLDFDLQDKMKLSPDQIKDAHNMLLYHAKSGRYEAQPMASEAPKYLNSMAAVGVTGMKGLNFTGAMTQILMKLAPATQPNEVATFMEHGLSHITSKQQVKGLAKFGINVEKYMPGGKFYGEGGVQGVMDLAAEMKSKGLDNPFNLDKAGFREMYTKKFWKQLMQYQDEIRQAIKEGEQAAMNDMVGHDKAEIMSSNYAKFKQWEITSEKGQLSDGATQAVGAGATVTGWAAEHPTAAIGGGIAALLGGRLLMKRMGFFGGKGGDALGEIIGGGKGMPVTVTNWPRGLGDPMKASERMSRLPGAGSAAGGAAGAAAGSAAMAAGTAAGIAAGGAMATVLATAATQANKEKLNDMSKTAMGGAVAGDYAVAAAIMTASEQAQQKQHTGFEAWLDKFSAKLVTLLGGVAERPIEVHVDGRAIAEVGNKANDRDARRQ
ncbi:MAG: hypothetical protein GAK35_03381 [Herbaspirillum frisingense]|uniref:Phage tail tape measure protein domain-containing protein n=1 Tax=Herbaspirillum frisingense TaxID=92645 RepID=A0A7V8FUB3_9BURK|nr:MAG: hypothetical protein GAK35_03381 [Herbaspirillum frisingense]